MFKGSVRRFLCSCKVCSSRKRKNIIKKQLFLSSEAKFNEYYEYYEVGKLCLQNSALFLIFKKGQIHVVYAFFHFDLNDRMHLEVNKDWSGCWLKCLCDMPSCENFEVARVPRMGGVHEYEQYFVVNSNFTEQREMCRILFLMRANFEFFWWMLHAAGLYVSSLGLIQTRSSFYKFVLVSKRIKGITSKIE